MLKTVLESYGHMRTLPISPWDTASGSGSPIRTCRALFQQSPSERPDYRTTSDNCFRITISAMLINILWVTSTEPYDFYSSDDMENVWGGPFFLAQAFSLSHL